MTSRLRSTENLFYSHNNNFGKYDTKKKKSEPCSFAARDDPPCFSFKFCPFRTIFFFKKRMKKKNRDFFRCVKSGKSNYAASGLFVGKEKSMAHRGETE